MVSLNDVVRALQLFNVNNYTQIPAVGTMTNKLKNRSVSKAKINTSFLKLKCSPYSIISVNLIKIIHKKLITNIIFNGKSLNVFFLRLGLRQRSALSILFSTQC